MAEASEKIDVDDSYFLEVWTSPIHPQPQSPLAFAQWGHFILFTLTQSWDSCPRAVQDIASVATRILPLPRLTTGQPLA